MLSHFLLTGKLNEWIDRINKRTKSVFNIKESTLKIVLIKNSTFKLMHINITKNYITHNQTILLCEERNIGNKSSVFNIQSPMILISKDSFNIFYKHRIALSVETLVKSFFAKVSYLRWDSNMYYVDEKNIHEPHLALLFIVVLF